VDSFEEVAHEWLAATSREDGQGVSGWTSGHMIPVKLQRGDDAMSFSMDAGDIGSIDMKLVQNEKVSPGDAIAIAVGKLPDDTARIYGSLARGAAEFAGIRVADNSEISAEKDQAPSSGEAKYFPVHLDVDTSVFADEQQLVQTRQREAAFFLNAAQLSLFLGLFNLLPIPGFDGWRMVMAVADRVTGKKLETTTANVILVIVAVAILFAFNIWGLASAGLIAL
jgi:hypothetical protein